MYRRIIKPLIDFFLGLIALVLLSPLFIVVFMILLISNNGKALFFQKRPGKHGKSFLLMKFKTMNDKKGLNGKLLPDEKRLTSAGKFVRSTSIDELPQLINVLKGDMSLVGPRPLLCSYLDRYTPEQARRHEVKPGITGWAQVNGRNAISWEQKFDLDVYYVDHMSFWLDLKILWLTLWKVIKRSGVTGSNSSTMHEFKGTKTN